MMGVDLGKKVGPLPLGGWLLAVGGGLGISFYVRHKGSSAPAVATAYDPSGAVLLPGGTVGGGGGAVGGTGAVGGSAPDPTLTPAGPAPILTNEDWMRAATNLLLFQGGDFGTISSALSHYFGGQPLSAAERAAIEQATRYLGAVPIAPPPAADPVGTTVPAAPLPPAVAPSPTSPVTPPPAPAPQSPPPLPVPVRTPSPVPAIPAAAVQVPNPVAGDTSTFVVGTTPEGYAYTYGGSAAQAQQLVSSPVQAAPSGYGLVSPTDNSVPAWYRMGFSDEASYRAVYG